MLTWPTVGSDICKVNHQLLHHLEEMVSSTDHPQARIWIRQDFRTTVGQFEGLLHRLAPHLQRERTLLKFGVTSSTIQHDLVLCLIFCLQKNLTPAKKHLFSLWTFAVGGVSSIDFERLKKKGNYFPCEFGLGVFTFLFSFFQVHTTSCKLLLMKSSSFLSDLHSSALVVNDVYGFLLLPFTFLFFFSFFFSANILNSLQQQLLPNLSVITVICLPLLAVWALVTHGNRSGQASTAIQANSDVARKWAGRKEGRTDGQAPGSEKAKRK